MHHVTPDHDKCSKQKGQPCLYKTIISGFQNMIDKKTKQLTKVSQLTFRRQKIKERHKTSQSVYTELAGSLIRKM